MLHLESSPHQGIYAPLSQAMTDSDSEEEIQIHSTSKHRQLQQQRLQQHQLQLQQLQQQQQQQQQQAANHKNNRRNRNPPNSLAINQRLQAPPQNQHLRQQRQQERLQQQHFQLQQQKHEPNSNNKYQPQNNSIGNGLQPSSYTTKMQTTFRSVMMSDMMGSGMHNEGPAGSNFSSFNSDYDERNHIDADNVAILGGSSSSSDLKHTAEPMSPTRRCCFIASLLLCVFAVGGFVWLVPCNEGSSCPAPADRVKTHNWFNKYTKIELKGGVHIVSGLRHWENNLIFLYRGDAFFPDSGSGRGNAKRNGIISLIGSSGAVAWYDEMVDEPVAIDCTLLDVDHNGRPDCLVIDECGQLGTINPISGQWHWRYKERSPHKVDALDFPVILPDLDGDGVLEVLLVTSATLEQRTKQHVQRGEVHKSERNLLRILSGRLGTPIGEGYKIHDCQVLRKLQLEESSQKLSFNCLRNNTEAQRSKTLAELFALITNKSLLGQRLLLPAAKIAQHRHYGQRKDIDAQRNIYRLSGRDVVVENRGKCPDNCNVTVVISETRDGKLKVKHNFTNSGMYGMVPTQWNFKDTKNDMSGFVMKFWKWNLNTNVAQNYSTVDTATGGEHEQKQKHLNMKKAKANTLKENAAKSAKPNQTHANRSSNYSKSQHKRALFGHAGKFDAFTHVTQQRHNYELPQQQPLRERLPRSVDATVAASNSTNKQKGKLLLDNYKMQLITEKVLLVVFIGAETRIENTSQSDIVQFCRRNPSSESQELMCQPDLNNQENSMLIADLDQDGSQELVSYMSTFVSSNDEGQDWKLVTEVRLLRLQSELPDLYENNTRN